MVEDIFDMVVRYHNISNSIISKQNIISIIKY